MAFGLGFKGLAVVKGLGFRVWGFGLRFKVNSQRVLCGVTGDTSLSHNSKS